MAIILTERGKRIALAIAAFTFLALIFRDVIIALVTAILAFFLLFDYVHAYSKQKNELRIKVQRKSYNAVAGEYLRINLELESPKAEELRGISFNLPGFNQLKFGSFENGIISFEGIMKFAGMSYIKELESDLPSRLKFFGIKSVHPIDEVKITIYPRFVVPLARLAEYEVIEATEGGEVKSFRISSVGEYALTREYVAGDDPRKIDWKATARLGTPKVKEFSSSYLGKINLIFDTTATDALSADRLASEFFSTLVDLADSGAVIKAFLYDGLHYEALRPKYLVEELVDASVKMLGRFIPEVGVILDLPFKRQSFTEKEDYVSEWFAESGRSIAITQLLSDLVEKLLISSNLQVGESGSLQQSMQLIIDTIIQPTIPWLTVDSVEDAYIIKKQIEKRISSLERMGIRVLTSLKYSGQMY